MSELIAKIRAAQVSAACQAITTDATGIPVRTRYEWEKEKS